ncbi:DNA replication/repair protein RecF [Halieaceae bacterium IMCC14734]|uniref:DNA replication and repair protein RecF n=1 Tax=Candidatus Litorirhabdus singularis TaxID=2518993 RepID=A0ABT3TEW8_9GAMM|nr:DNA replication/repair protein RecF [Candidatus Litorirhabdus singularis]MCX2979967.1 DNA replication/repair protein RecF [Candidatus Litorirhabdus singularis]
MALKRLDITAVRNLKQVSVRNLGVTNVFFGENGGGKTSILESVYLLGMARSFRSSQIKPVIQHGMQGCSVFGELAGKNGRHAAVGITRDRTGSVKIKVNGDAITTVSALAEQQPMQILHAQSFELLTGGPIERRRFLDWGVFHVEHRYQKAWSLFQRCIKQRNSLLRHGKISAGELEPWSQQLVQSGEKIDEWRQAYFAELIAVFSGLLKRLAPELPLMELRYRRGWDKKLTLQAALESSLASDIEQGYTHIGPQRADIRVVCDGHDAGSMLSRGQQKLVVCALKLAQGQILSSQKGTSCIYLVDDLPSELDAEHCRLVCEVLSGLNAQVFITCVDPAELLASWPGLDVGGSMFHVEQGQVTRQEQEYKINS